MTDISLQNERLNAKGFLHPYKVILYLSMASIIMFFAITTSALLVKKGDVVSWQQFKLPSIFYISTIILVSSSVFIHYALKKYEDIKFKASRILLTLSILASVLFLVLQLLGFAKLNEIGMPLAGNASGSFIWVIVIAHGLHIIGGLFFSILILIKSIINRNDKNFEGVNTLNPKRKLSLELLAIYWHFIDFIWIYLFIFFYFNYQ